MAKNKLFEEAIADAKAMRAAALANAKLALEESITPRLQSMISAKLQEVEDEDELDEAKDEEMDESLDKFLSELEDGESDMQDRNQVDENEEEGEEDATDDYEEPAEEEGDDEATDDMEAEDVKISDLSVDEFKDIIRSVVQDEMGGAHSEAGAEDEMGAGDEFGAPEMGGGDEDQDVNLDELLADLDGLNESEDEEELDEAKEAKGKITAKKRPINGITAKNGNANVGSSKSGYKSAPNVAVTKQLEEATKTVRVLSKELKEVNLLNAKLLFVNKLFKGNNLSESQKLKVIESFDRATTAKEAKNVFESLNESIKKRAKNGGKSQLKESLSFASKATGSTRSKSPIVADATVERFKKLANIK